MKRQKQCCGGKNNVEEAQFFFLQAYRFLLLQSLVLLKSIMCQIVFLNHQYWQQILMT